MLREGHPIWADMAMRPNSINKEIEYLRAVAILLVVGNHYLDILGWGTGPVLIFGAWTGVDLFFCISGFVISKSFLTALEKHGRDGRRWLVVQAFWVRRFFRIIPSAWFWVAVLVFCSLFFNEYGQFPKFSAALRSAVAIVSYVANFALYTGALVNPFRIYWSLALEEQFYFVFPFFILMPAVVCGTSHWRSNLVLL